jgi:arginase
MMKHLPEWFCLCLIILPLLCFADPTDDVKTRVTVCLVLNPYSGSRSGPDRSDGPSVLAMGGIRDILTEQSHALTSDFEVTLTPEEEEQYGEWHRLGLSNGHLAREVARLVRSSVFPVGLLANCNSLMGMLGGLQHSGPDHRPLRVGLVWIDAHGDFNTPETTLSGMLGGMPVAVSAGLCLHRLRLKSGLDPALPTKYIVMAGVRDTDPLEQELIDRSQIEMISVQDIRENSDRIDEQMERLSRLTEIIYIHIDMDVLEPDEVRGHGLTVADGPSSHELGSALKKMFSYPKAAALGIASYPAGRDADGKSKAAAYRLISSAVEGVKERKNR